MKPHSYFKLALFFIALILFNCQYEDDSLKRDSSFVYENPLYQQQIVNLSEIPEIERSIRSTYPSIFRNANIGYSAASSTSASNVAIIDLDHILEIIDTLNNKNYSIRFRFADTPLSEFYNLVIAKDTLGLTTTPFVLKYKCDASQVDQYISNDFDFTYFKGTMELHKYTDYFQEGPLATTIGGDTVNCPPDFDEVGDPIPCETTPINPSGSGGASSDDGSGITGGPLDSDFGEDSDASDDLVWICIHRGEIHPDPSYCNNPKAGGIWVVNTSAPPRGSRVINNEYGIKTGDCPSCDISSPTGIGINPIPMKTVRTVLKRNLNLSEAGIDFIGNSNNNGAVTQVYYYIEPYIELDVTISTQARAFAEQAIEALASSLFSELIQEYRPKMSASEIVIFDNMSIVKQIVYLSNAQKASSKANELYPNWKDQYNGKGDAFRHALWNAKNVIGLGSNLSESLATAHEDKPSLYLYNDKENQMDLFNNKEGRKRAYFLSDGFTSFEESILDAINRGDLRYLNNLDPVSNRATNSSVLTPTNQ